MDSMEYLTPIMEHMQMAENAQPGYPPSPATTMTSAFLSNLTTGSTAGTSTTASNADTGDTLSTGWESLLSEELQMGAAPEAGNGQSFNAHMMAGSAATPPHMRTFSPPAPPLDKRPTNPHILPHTAYMAGGGGAPQAAAGARTDAAAGANMALSFLNMRDPAQLELLQRLTATHSPAYQASHASTPNPGSSATAPQPPAHRAAAAAPVTSPSSSTTPLTSLLRSASEALPPGRTRERASGGTGGSKVPPITDEQRKERNREIARKSRLRRKAYMKNLEDRLKAMESSYAIMAQATQAMRDDNRKLKQTIQGRCSTLQSLHDDNTQLKADMTFLKTQLRNGGGVQRDRSSSSFSSTPVGSPLRKGRSLSQNLSSPPLPTTPISS